MATTDAAELRRQKILLNGEKRLEMLLGIKNSETSATDITNDSVKEVHLTHLSTRLIEPEIVQPPIEIIQTKRSSIVADVASPTTETPIINDKFKCQFTGYSNLEIMIIFSLAIITTLLFYFEKSDLIYQNALLPFVTFEIAHLILHFNCLPATSTQYQMFITLLRLCGIPQTSLKNLLTTLNFLFILNDNFVIYLFCFIICNMLLHLLVVLF